MKIDILFALPGPQSPVGKDKPVIVAAATEHEDPRHLATVIADVAEAALQAGAYRAVRKVTLELEEALVMALLTAEQHTTSAQPPAPARLSRAALH